MIAGETRVPYPRQNHRSIVGRKQIGDRIVRARLAEHDARSPQRIAVRVQPLQHDTAIASPGDYNIPVCRTGDLRDRVEAGIAGELHTAASPYLPSTIVDLGCGDLLVRACARVEESQQRVARCVYIEAIVLRGTVALSRDQRAIMRQQLDSGGTQALEANVVAD